MSQTNNNMETDNDMDADDFFEQMIREEQQKVSAVKNILINKTKPTTTVRETSSNIPNNKNIEKKDNLELELELLLQQQNPQQILQTLQRDINCLTSNERGKRIQSIKKIRKFFDILLQNQDKYPILDYLKFFFSHIYQPILKLFSNETELCRENAVQLFLTFSDYLTVNELEESLPFTIPILEERMMGEKENFCEESEEVRVLLVRLVKNIILKCKSKIENDPDYLQKILNFLMRCCEDFYGVKSESCKCMILICETFRDSTTRLFSESLIKRLIPNLKHQRSNVRVDTLEAINHLIIHGTASPLEDLHSHLTELCLDRSNTVRQELLKTISNWGLNLRDRYSYQHNFLYYLLLLCADEIIEISKSAFTQILELGQLHEKDYENDVNETKMYDDNENNEETSKLYKSAERLPTLPLAIGERPILGSRLLIKKNLMKLINYLLKDMDDWNLHKRIINIRALQFCIVFGERNLTQHVDKLLTSLFNLNTDNEKEIREETIKCIALLGYFLEPDAYLGVIYNYMKPEYSASPRLLTSVLNCLSILLAHSDSNLTNRYLQEITNKLNTSHLIFCEETNLKLAILNVSNSLIMSHSVESLEEGLSLFLIIIRLCSQPNTKQEVIQAGVDTLQKESSLFEFTTIDEIYAIYFEKALEYLTTDVTSWDKLSPNFYAFEALVKNGSKAVIQHFHRVLQVFSIYLTPERDPFMVLRLMTVLNTILFSIGKDIDQENLKNILIQFIYTNSKWKNGRIYADIRKIAMSCLACILKQNLISREDITSTLVDEQVVDNLLSCLDDDFDPMLRIITSKLLVDYLNQTYTLLNEKQWDNISHELRNRMEDENDTVRLATISAITQIMIYLPSLLVEQSKGMIFCLATHMDDSNYEIRKACLLAFQTIIQYYKQNQHLEFISHRLDIINQRLHGFLQSAIHVKSDLNLPYHSLLELTSKNSSHE